MEGIIFLIIAAFLFAVIGVIVLLVKTSGQAETLGKYGRRLSLLEDRVRSLSSGHAPAGMEAPRAGEAAADAPAVIEAEPEAPETAAAYKAPPPVEAPAPAAVFTAADAPAPAAVFSAADAPETAAAYKAPPPADAPAPSSALKNSLAAFIHGGNLWAAGGIILLIAAFAMLITYLANRGFFTVEMGIAAAAFSGLVMLAAGWRFRKKRPVYFLLLQGGGIGILYLSIFAAHKLTPYFPPLVSLVLMSLLLPPALILALFQGSQALALLGFLGGYAAPLLLAAGEGNHVFLFAYYGILNLGVLVISLFRPWQGLKLLAFLCTFILANFWAAAYYEPALFGQTEPFFLAYILIFTFLGIRRSGTEEKRRNAYAGPALILGTPIAGAVLQWKIFEPVPHGYALICLIFSAFYLALAFILWKRRGEETRLFSEGYIGLGLLLANLAIPLELAPRITSAVWAAEGAVVFFFGLRQKNLKTAAGGLILHLAAAAAFAAEQDIFAYGQGAFRSVRFTGSLVIALSALAMVFFTGRSSRSAPEGSAPENPAGPPVFPPAPGIRAALALGIWAFAWWFGGWSYEIYRALDNPGAALFLLCSASALAAFAASRPLRSPVYRLGMIPAPALALFLTLAAFISRVPAYLPHHPWMILSRNFFEGPFLWGWLAFFAVQAILLFFSRHSLAEELHGLWLLLVVFITLGVLSSSGRALTLSHELAPAWTSLAGMAPVFITMAGLSLWGGKPPHTIPRSFAQQNSKANPQGSPGFRKKIILFVLPLALSGIMGIWFLVTLFLSGDPAPLPFYIPFINPLDLEEAFCIALFLLWQSVLRKRGDLPRLKNPALFTIIDAMIFLFAVAVTARSIHFYGDVPYRRVFNSETFHLCLFILWAVYGIGHIIGGSRLSLRKVWIAGAALTVADIAKLLIRDLAGAGAVTRIVSFFIAGLLLLFIGWAAPLPPPAGKGPKP